MKIVIDCNVLIAAVLKDGLCRSVLRHNLQWQSLYTSEPILLEYLRVARREKFQNFKRQLDFCVKMYSEIAEVSHPPRCEHVLPDKGDLKYIELCSHIGAHHLISGNLKDFPDVTYGKTKVISPREYAELFMSGGL